MKLYIIGPIPTDYDPLAQYFKIGITYQLGINEIKKELMVGSKPELEELIEIANVLIREAK